MLYSSQEGFSCFLSFLTVHTENIFPLCLIGLTPRKIQYVQYRITPLITDHIQKNERTCCIVQINGKFIHTFSAEAPVRTNVEKTGRGYLLLDGQHSIVAPIGRQKRGTDSGKGNES